MYYEHVYHKLFSNKTTVEWSVDDDGFTVKGARYQFNEVLGFEEKEDRTGITIVSIKLKNGEIARISYNSKYANKSTYKNSIEEKLAAKGDEAKNAVEFLKSKIAAALEVCDEESVDDLGVIDTKSGTLKRSKILAVYRECREKEITSIEDTENNMLFRLICKKNNIPESAMFEDIISLGESIEQEIQGKLEKDNKIEQREQNVESNKKLKELSEVTGIQKYMLPLNEEIERAQYWLQVEENIRVLGQKIEVATPSKSSWAIAGGAASAIAGPGVGAAVAINKMNENKRIEGLANEASSHNIKTNHNAAGRKAPYERQIAQLNDEIEKLKSKLCDTEHTDVFSEYYSFYIDSETPNGDGTVELLIKAEKERPFTLGSVEIDVDGSACIQALYNDEVVGEGYLIGDGYRAGDSNRGFLEDKEYSVTIVPFDDNYDITIDSNTEFTITPINFWMIEK